MLHIQGQTSSEETVGWQMTDDHACNVLSLIKEGFATQSGLLNGGIQCQNRRVGAFKVWHWKIGLGRYSDDIWLLNLLNPLNHWGVGGAVRPSLPFFLPFTQNYHEAPIPENSWPCKPYEKIIKKFIFTLLSKHFEIWVWKPPMG